MQTLYVDRWIMNIADYLISLLGEDLGKNILKVYLNQ